VVYLPITFVLFAPTLSWCVSVSGNVGVGVEFMLGTGALVVVITLTALAVVLYAAYCEAGEDLPCKKARRHAHAASAGAPHRG